MTLGTLGVIFINLGFVLGRITLFCIIMSFESMIFDVLRDFLSLWGDVCFMSFWFWDFGIIMSSQGHGLDVLRGFHLGN